MRAAELVAPKLPDEFELEALRFKCAFDALLLAPVQLLSGTIQPRNELIAKDPKRGC